MKIRNGFVANSSSSSYVCDVCSEVIEVYDSDFEGYGIIFCEKGHVLEDCHLDGDIEIIRHLEKDEALKRVKEFLDIYIEDEKKSSASWRLSLIKEGRNILDKALKIKDEDWESFFRDEVADYILWEFEPIISTENCIICNLEHISAITKKEYLLSIMGISEEELIKKIQEEFTDLEDLKRFFN